MENEQGNQAVVVRNESLSLKQVTDRVNLIHEVLKKVMKQNTHFGAVPGCGGKMVLLKPGADLLAMTFRLVPEFRVEMTNLPNDHREFAVTCSMRSPDGALLGQGVGSASTMEKKYRYRKDNDGNRIENEDIADVFNTVLKIAKKRAHIDATLTVTGAADLFTQDLIDEDDEPKKLPVKMPTETKAEPAPANSNTVTGVIDAVSVKESPADAKKPWKKYGVKIGENWYATFDAKIGANATKGAAVTIVYKTNEKGYHEIMALQPVAMPTAVPTQPAGEVMDSCESLRLETIQLIRDALMEAHVSEGRFVTYLRKSGTLKQYGGMDDMSLELALPILKTIGHALAEIKEAKKDE